MIARSLLPAVDADSARSALPPFGLDFKRSIVSYRLMLTPPPGIDDKHHLLRNAFTDGTTAPVTTYGHARISIRGIRGIRAECEAGLQRPHSPWATNTPSQSNAPKSSTTLTPHRARGRHTGRRPVSPDSAAPRVHGGIQLPFEHDHMVRRPRGSVEGWRRFAPSGPWRDIALTGRSTSNLAIYSIVGTNHPQAPQGRSPLCRMGVGVQLRHGST